MIRSAAVVLTLLFSQGVMAQSSDAPKKDGIVVKGEHPEDKKICKSVVETGSILPRRVCKTQGQVDEERRKSLEALELARQTLEAQRHVREVRGAGAP